MCGINVIVDKKGKIGPEAIARMTGCTTHRGPDHQATWHTQTLGQHIYFGHNRLRILDLSEKANQPFFSADKRYVLLYNGELYNYKELRQQLPNYHFKTESDTEVVLAMLVTQGRAALPKLNGMFALVLFDQLEGTLLAARDRFGIKPLFFSQTPELLLLSSELQAITSSGMIPKKLNESQIGHYLRYKFAKKPATFFEGVQELLEGSFLSYHSGSGEAEIHSYISKTEEKLPIAELMDGQLLKQTEELLLASVQRQLAADVPVGLFLSGGTDSSLLLAMLAELGHTGFPTFSVDTLQEEQSFGSQDHLFAPLAAQLFNADHKSFEINTDLLQHLPEVLAGIGQPIADSAALLTWHLSREARKTVTVALSGAGADELFAGYNRHRAFYSYLTHRKKARVLLPLLKPASKMLPSGIHHPMRKQFQLVKKMVPALSVSAKQTFLNFCAMHPELQKLLLQNGNLPAHTKPDADSTEQLLAWALQHDRHSFLVSDVLAMTDAMSMRHSLEVRVPYLDNELQQFLAAVPVQLLFRQGRKRLLREMLSARGGSAFANRPKEGLGLPLGAWFRQPATQWVLKLLQQEDQVVFRYLNFNRTQILLRAHQSGRADYSSEIWALVVLAWWLQQEFG